MHCAASAVPPDSFKSATTTAAPSRQKRSAVAAPIPLAAPVITATLFSSRPKRSSPCPHRCASTATAEQPKGTGIAVQEGAAVHRADLAVAEAAAEGDLSGMAGEDACVVIRSAVEVHAAAQTREQQCALRAVRPAAARIAGQQVLEVVRRGLGVTQVKLDD